MEMFVWPNSLKLHLMCACVCVQAYVCMCVSMHVYVCVHTCVCVMRLHVCIPQCVCVHATYTCGHHGQQAHQSLLEWGKIARLGDKCLTLLSLLTSLWLAQLWARGTELSDFCFRPLGVSTIRLLMDCPYHSALLHFLPPKHPQIITLFTVPHIPIQVILPL